MIAIDGVSVTFGGGLVRKSSPVTALDNVSLSLARGECHGLVGESGSGKTTLGRVILGLQKADRGKVAVAGEDVSGLGRRASRRFRRRVQVVFQDSAASFNPRMSIGASVAEGLHIHRIGKPPMRREAVSRMLEKVGLTPDYASRYPHELSGGQRQRVNIARALVLEPEILVADEPVSALDVSVQAQILDLIAELRSAMSLTMIFISHDLHVVREVCETVSIMHGGKIVEHGDTARIFDAPTAPYSQELLRAV